MSQSLRFIYTAIYSGVYRDIFQRRTLSEGLIAGVFVLNLLLRKRDVEEFGDMRLEYVRAERQGKNAWKNKDAAVYLVKAVVTRSGTFSVRLVLRIDCA